MKASTFRTLIYGLGALLVVIFSFTVLKTANGPETEADMPVRAITSPNLGGAFELVDENGDTVTDQDYTRPYRLIYFGFTFCPAICPTELAKTVRAFKQLPEDVQDQIDLLFVSIDPERDTAEVIKQYTDLFHPRMIGLTGNQTQIDKVTQDYKVYAAKVEDDTMSDYTMDHSSYIYLFGSDNQVKAMYRMDDEADFIAQDLAKFFK